MHRLVLASGSAGKLREFRLLLAPIAVVPQADLGIASAEEPHHTFVENALAKARHAAAHSRLPALADDSGLCCNALDGAPGVYSARFAGQGASDERNNALLIERLQGLADRHAHYVCALVAVRSANDPEPLIALGRWPGLIVDTAQGQGGFGYDPHFFLPNQERTAAELSAEQKNALSHRGIALRAIREQLQSVWGWLT
ncbi:MAG TPA: RdgB/HAM1 family non-canonical purine NTP pyrophosphatase [Burkholderiaceae bacterium]|nr:RdgB/HAM1 family non-canonical purine NTP pyrophosphatase [Burkholderiaceae bacterium]